MGREQGACFLLPKLPEFAELWKLRREYLTHEPPAPSLGDCEKSPGFLEAQVLKWLCLPGVTLGKSHTSLSLDFLICTMG